MQDKLTQKRFDHVSVLVCFAVAFSPSFPVNLWFVQATPAGAKQIQSIAAALLDAGAQMQQAIEMPDHLDRAANLVQVRRKERVYQLSTTKTRLRWHPWRMLSSLERNPKFSLLPRL
jgi:hypothetical protein